MIRKIFFIKLSIILMLLMASGVMLSQNWALMNGNCNYSVAASYGTLTVSSPSNYPGGRASACSFKDLSGNLWYFGGIGFLNNGTKGYFNDMWKYIINTNQWVWMKGSSSPNQLAVYGTMGVPSATNDPGGRMGSFHWTDQAGNFWVFGGETSTNINTQTWFSNDLWKYNVSTNQWTWMNGINGLFNPNDNTGSYGTLGVPSPTVYPSARGYGISWVDLNGNLWMYGGRNLKYGGSHFNDLWMYNITTNQWTWVHGSSSPTQYAAYGTIGVPSTTATPGSRVPGVSWTDNSGFLWLFGGVGYLFPNSWGYENDLWKFNISTSQWTCVRGLAVASATTPSARYFAFGSKENSGDFLLFGGTGGTGTLSDLWRYNISADQWNQVIPSSTATACYSYGIASPNAMPSPAFEGNSWTDNCGNFWIRGGSNITFPNQYQGFNALWRLNQSGARCVPNPVNICNGASVTLSATASSAINWYSSPTSTQTLASGGLFTTGNLSTGTYSYYATASSCSTSTIPTEVLVIVKNPTVNVLGSNTLCLGSNLTQTATGAANYTWSSGATTSVVAFTPTTTTQYTVTGTDNFGCVGSSINTITVFNPPVLSLSGSNILCKGSSLIKNVSGASSYSWSTGATTASVSLNPMVNTTFTASGTSSDNCTSFSIFTITVIPSPTITANSGTVCAMTIFTILPSGAINYTYSGGTNTVMPTTTTIFTITGSGSNGCTSSITNTVFVNPLPNIAVSNGTVCPGQSFTISPSGSVSYSISGGLNIVSPTATTIYSVIGTTSAGCVSQSATTLQVSAFPNPTITISNGSVCLGQSYLLQPTGASTYTSSSGSLVVSPTVNTVYTLTGTSNAGCVSQSVTCSVAVKPLPVINVTTSQSLICSGTSVTLSAQGAITYTWDNGSVNSLIVVSPTINIVYNAFGTDSAGCVNNGAVLQVVSPCTSITQNISPAIEFYPNPVDKEIFISVPYSDGLLKLQIVSNTGQILLIEKLNNKLNKIKVDKLEAGFYQFFIYSEGRLIKNEKIIKN